MSFLEKFKYIRALRTFGWKESLIKMYTVGDIKFGALMGTDRAGNKYFENTADYPFGQHRWVEYSDIHNYDASMVPPEWHGWLHHQTDFTPDKEPSLASRARLEVLQAGLGHSPFNHHEGLVASEPSEDVMHNKTLYRQRGYQVGTLGFTKGGAPDEYYKQPGHPLHELSEKGGRFKTIKGLHEFDPADPEGLKNPPLGLPLRDLEKN